MQAISGHASTSAASTLQAIGKSRSGNTSKIHLAVDTHGLPITLIITGGQLSDMTVACELMSQIKLIIHSTVIADKGYRSEKIRIGDLSNSLQQRSIFHTG